jgi:release factor glutamine methyltransferase
MVTTPMTLLELLDRTTAFFTQKGIESPRLQVEWLVAHVLQKKRMTLYVEFERPMAAAELDQLRPLVKRRAEGEPLQHILGETEFFGLNLKCSPAALIPRPESEVLIEKVLDTLEKESPGTLVDVGTGTGCLALTCATHLPAWKIIGTDISADALALARENNQLHPELKVEWQQGSLLSSLDTPPDVIVANLPYLNEAEMSSLQKEVTYDPALALDGGADGLDLIRDLCQSIPASTRYCFLEAGTQHQDAMRELLTAAGFSQVEIFADLNGHQRFAMASRSDH